MSFNSFSIQNKGYFFTFNQISNTSIKNNCRINGNGGAMKIIETIWWTMKLSIYLGARQK